MAAITTAAIGAGTAIYSAKKASKAAKEQNKLAQQGIEASDPFGKYRDDYAAKLNKLMEDPSSITETPEYKARLEAAARTMASQGYAGSGNAIIEAANAGGAAFDQAVNRLSVLAGAGATPGSGYGNALETMAAGNDQKMSAYAGIANNMTNLASTLGDKFNKSASGTTIGPVTKQVQLEPVKVGGF